MNEHARLQDGPAGAQGGRDNVRDCPACGRPTGHRFLYARNGCGIFQCTICGLGRTEASGFDPETYYTRDYFDGGHADGYADYLGAEPVLRREFASTVDFIRGFKQGGRLLELGCAYGFFLAAARPHFDVTGIEIAEDAAAHGRSLGLNVITGAVDERMLAGLAPFDVIVLLDVIEHLPDPLGTLALCERHLNPGGIIVIATGDFGSWPARIAGARWRLMTPPQHLWFFTRDSMRGMAASLGLRMERFEHPWKIVPLSLIVFQLKRMFGMRPTRASAASAIGLPANLFDAMRVVLRKPEL
jgi:SAM-dependent methyltransferase